MAVAVKKKRNFKKSAQLVHDLFKLTVAKTLKNMSWDSSISYQEVEHVHFFHTVDSKGTPQNTSSAIAGHFHVMELVTPAGDDSPAVYKCSPPMIHVRSRDRMTGNYRLKLQLANKDDQHTHDVQYLDSHEFTVAKLNPEFIKLQQTVGAAPPAVPGIEG